MLEMSYKQEHSYMQDMKVNFTHSGRKYWHWWRSVYVQQYLYLRPVAARGDCGEFMHLLVLLFHMTSYYENEFILPYKFTNVDCVYLSFQNTSVLCAESSHLPGSYVPPCCSYRHGLGSLVSISDIVMETQFCFSHRNIQTEGQGQIESLLSQPTPPAAAYLTFLLQWSHNGLRRWCLYGCLPNKGKMAVNADWCLEVLGVIVNMCWKH